MNVKMPRLMVFALLAATILCLGLTLAQEDDGILDDFTHQFEALWNAEKVEALTALFTEDAVIYGATGSVFDGREAIRVHLREDIGAGIKLSLTAIDSEVIGDTTSTLGHYAFTVQNDGETVAQGGGYYLLILKRENGAWRIYRDISTTTIAPQETNDEAGQGRQ